MFVYLLRMLQSFHSVKAISSARDGFTGGVICETFFQAASFSQSEKDAVEGISSTKSLRI